MSKFKLAFGIHNHQPVGNFEAVFHQAHHEAYLPFLRLVAEFDGLGLSLHQSGILWDWQKRAEPDFFELVGRLVDNGRIELLTGAFYEPILIAIPERDARGQIRMLTDYLGRHFETKTDGFWLAERIWEPHLPKLLAQAGVKFLPIDDTHFLYAGFEHEQLTGPFVTEHEGYTVRLLPIQKRLRYLIPFGTVEEVIDELKRQAGRNPEGMAVYADDGEKFGVWPNTHQHCYTDGWLKEFFEAVLANDDWLEMVPLGQAAVCAPAGRAYLPSASYEEMLHWALPTNAYLEYETFERWLQEQQQKERFGRFVRGGHWRGFLTKYEESNLMHKKMLSLSERLADVENELTEKDERPDTIRKYLFAAQCNCPYWHGVFGGLYLPHIRQAIYANLARAEKLLDEFRPANGVHFTVSDYDADGSEEVLIDNGELSLIVKPRCGGMLVDLTLLRQGVNVTDTLSRRREGYHLKLSQAVRAGQQADSASIHDVVWTKEDGLADYLVEDWHLKRCFLDHFFGTGITPEGFARARFPEEGDFILESFQFKVNPAAGECRLTREGRILRSGKVIPVQVEKVYRLQPGRATFDVAYRLSTPSKEPVAVDFAVENNLTFQAGHAEDRYVLIDGRRPDEAYLDGTGVYPSVHAAMLVDEYRSISAGITADREAEIWRLPIFTVSLSEGGFERVYQGTTLVHRFALKLSSKPVELLFSVTAGDLSETVKRDGLTAAAAASLAGRRTDI